MKNILFIAVWLTVGMSVTTLSAQNEDARRTLEERIETQRIAFITEKVNLTRDEAQAFWPIYNEYREQSKTLREHKIPTKSIIDMTDEESQAHIDKVMLAEQAELDLKLGLTNDLKVVITPRKVLRFFGAERQFKERLLKMMNQRRNKQQNGRK